MNLARFLFCRAEQGGFGLARCRDNKKAATAGLMAHLRRLPHDAPFYGVTLDENKNPRPNEVEAGAQTTGMIRVMLRAD